MPTVKDADSEGRPAFIAVVIFTFILLLSPQNWIPALAPFRIAFLAAGAAAVLLLWERWHRIGPRRTPRREVILAMALATWALLTVPLSYWPGGSLNLLSDLYLKALAIFWLLANVVTTAHRLRLVAMSLLLCTIPLAGTALKNFMTGKFHGGVAPAERIIGYQSGLSSNPNDLALMLNLVIPLGVALFLSNKKAIVRIFCLLVIAFAIVGVILTFSRGGFLGLATTGTVYFTKLIRRPGSDRNWAFALLLVGMLLLPLLPSNYLGRIATMTDIETDPTGSAQERWGDNVVAMRFIIAHPIVGAGLGMDVLALNEERGPRWLRIHNVYLEYAVDLGLPGLVLFLLVLYGAFSTVRAARRRAASEPALRDLFLVNEGLEVSLIVFAIVGFFHPAAYNFYFYYIAGLALASRLATDSALSVTNTSGDAASESYMPHIAYGRRFMTSELP